MTVVLMRIQLVTVFFDAPVPIMDDNVELCLGAQAPIIVGGGDYYN